MYPAAYWESLAQKAIAAFQAEAKRNGHLPQTLKTIPAWDDQTPQFRAAWIAAIRKAVEEHTAMEATSV